MNQNMRSVSKKIWLVLLLVGVSIVVMGCEKTEIGTGIGNVEDLIACGGKCVSPPPCLVSWWPGDGSAEDIEDDNDGTLQNGTTFASGKVGQAFSFDGVDDYVEVPFDSNLLPSHITIDAWVKFDTIPTNDLNQIVHKVSSYGLWLGATAGIGQTDKFSFGIMDSATGTWKYAAGTTTAIPDTFYHVAGTYDGNTIKIYVNGVLEGQVALTGPIPQTPASYSPNVFVGWDGGLGAPNPALDGLIDELEIHNCALSLSDIQSIFNADSAGKCK